MRVDSEADHGRSGAAQPLQAGTGAGALHVCNVHLAAVCRQLSVHSSAQVRGLRCAPSLHEVANCGAHDAGAMDQAGAGVVGPL